MTTWVRLPTLLGALTLAAGLGACFDGVGTIGAICFADSQCGLEQRCVNSVCGKCGDREAQPGELCFGNSDEQNVFGAVADLLPVDRESDGNPALVGVVNTNCEQPPMTGPPTADGPACWGLYFVEVDPSKGDITAMELIAPYLDGKVPQMAGGNFDGESDGDRVLDIAIAIAPNDPLADSSQLAILHNFPAPQSFDLDVSVIPKTLHAADLDGDGLDDLLIGGEASSSLALFIATPGVGFEAERLLVTDPSPRPAPPVDMDNDGDLDIVVISATGNSIGVDLNNGNANFSAGGRVSLNDALVPNDVATADFDLDGNMDAVVFLSAPFGATVESELRVYRGLGDGSLELLDVLPGGDRPVSGLAVDINRDGMPDIVVADEGEDKLPVHINRGGSFPDIVQIDVSASPRKLMYEDFDGDGVQELIVGNANGVIALVPSEN